MNKKKLLPIVYALEKANLNQKRRLGEVYFKRVLEPDDVSAVREVLEELGAKEACQNLADQYLSEALSALNTQAITSEGRSQIEGYILSLTK